MQAPTTPTLRPLGMTQLLDQAIRLYRRNWLTFIAIIAIVLVPTMLVQTGFSVLSQQSSATRAVVQLRFVRHEPV